MLFKRELVEKILMKWKWQTRRLRKPGEEPGEPIYDTYWDRYSYTHVTSPNGRVKWKVGSTYAVQPGRGQKQVARFRLLKIREEDVRGISNEDAFAEGFPVCAARYWFLKTWCGFHDKPGLKCLHVDDDWLEERPVNRYRAWALDFELVEPAIWDTGYHMYSTEIRPGRRTEHYLDGVRVREDRSDKND